MAPPNSVGNPLAAGSLATFMATSLPRDASPQLKSPYDTVALAVHAGMLAMGFRLVGLGEDHRIETSSEAHDPHPLPNEWNAHDSYAFRYAHGQSAMEYLIKVNRLGTKAVVFGLGLGDDKTTQFEVVARDYISESSLPATHLSGDSDDDISEAAKKLEEIFISSGRLTDLGSLLKISIIQKLTPGLQKEGYEDDRQEQRREPERPAHDPLRDDPIQPPPARPHPFADPLAAGPPQAPRGIYPDGRPPGFDDEHEILQPPHRGGMLPGRNPLNIGEDDLYPQGLGPHDPFRPMGPGLRQPGGGGGMHPNFDDPLFAGQGGHGGFDPQAPPGARYDPLHPGDPRGSPGRGNQGGMGGLGGMGGGGPRNPFGGFGGGDFI